MLRTAAKPLLGHQSAPHDFSRTKAIVLDPFQVSRRLIADMLIRDLKVGEVRAVTLPGDALHLIATGDFNLLFTDWSSEVDALTLLRYLRGPDSPNRYLPVVVVSSYTSLEHLHRARDAGMTEYMLKPFNAQTVAARLRSITQAPRPYVDSPDYFGPCRRRRSQDLDGAERRRDGTACLADRRCRSVPHRGAERRQHGGPLRAGDQTARAGVR